MTVARWEFWSLANMVVSAHGSEAEAHAEQRLAEATRHGDTGQTVVWTEVLAILREKDRQSGKF